MVGPGDLVATNDYRDVLSEILTKRLNNLAIDAVFPGHNAQLVNVLTEVSD